MTKRILVFVAVVAAVSLLALPAFADSIYTFDPADDDGYFVTGTPVPEGLYYLVFEACTINDDFIGELYSAPFTLYVDEYMNASNFYYDASGVTTVTFPSFISGTYTFDISITGFHQDGSYDVEVLIDDDHPLDWAPDVLLSGFYLEPVPPAGQPGSDNEEGGVLAMVESVVSAIFAVFTAIGGWFVEFLPTLTAIFWTGEALTFLGVLAILGLGISVIFLLINVIRRFLNFGR